MFAKLSACACTALLLSGSAALAQPTADEQRDRSVSAHDDRQTVEGSALIKRDDAKYAELLHRANHEQGDQRKADLADAERYRAQAQAERDKLKGLKANNQATEKDYHNDLTDKPH